MTDPRGEPRPQRRKRSSSGNHTWHGFGVYEVAALIGEVGMGQGMSAPSSHAGYAPLRQTSVRSGVRLVTRLSQFGFRSRLKTWAYRLSVNYILDLEKSPIERLELTFQRFADNLTEGIEPASADETERSVPINEVKVACSLAMHADASHAWRI